MIFSSEIGDHLNCHLARSPSHAVMTWSGNGDRENYIKILVEASKKFGPGSVTFQMFNSTKYGGKDLLFKDSTKELVDVGDKKTYEEWLEKKYLDDVEAISTCPTKAAAAGVLPVASLVIASILTIFTAF